MGGVTALGVLGPLLLEDETGPVRIGSVRQRRLLAALAAHLGCSVGIGQLVDLVWGDVVLADPAGAVQTNVARLRRLLPVGLRLVTTPEGYCLAADRAAVDVTAFADHLAAAAGAVELDVRRDRLAAALGLWRGLPFPELDHPAIAPEVARLVELRAGAVEQHAEALLAEGRAGDAVAEVEALVTAEPLREGAVGVLMRALVAAGRQGDALAAFARLRRRLADDLGLDPSPQLRELERRVLRQDLPAPPAPRPTRAAGPRLPISSFVGRDAAVAHASALVESSRVVTLCGPGGVGKTRLALHVAAALAGRYADGVLVVEFGEGGPDDVEPMLAAALRMVAASADDPFADRLVALLALRHQLLVLDNCEHVADKVAAVVETVSAAAPGVDLLLTSREPLRVDGERVLGVDPLSPDAAAELLVDRICAAARDPDTQAGIDPELVAEVCRRLDRLPLALELAAARAAPLGLRGLLHALDEPFAALSGGRRTATPRHRSLRDVVAWSHGLLDDEQRRLFQRMSVFAGAVEYAAVVAVCGDASALPDLVDRSLVVRQAGEPPAYGMLETLRAYGRAQLAADPEAQRLRVRHARWAAGLADEIAAGRRGAGEIAAHRRFDTHLADLRRAQSWLCAHGPVDELVRLTVPVAELSFLRGRTDLVLFVEETLRALGVLDPDRPIPDGLHPTAATLLAFHGHSLWPRGRLDEAERQARRAIALADAVAAPVAARDAHEVLANVCMFRGDLLEGRRHARIARGLALTAGDPETRVTALTDLAILSAYAGDHAASTRYEREAAALVADAGSSTGRAYLAYIRGECRAERGDPEAGLHLRHAVEIADEAGLWFIAGIARHTLITTGARADPDPASALLMFGPLLGHWYRYGAWTQLWIALRAFVEIVSRAGRHGDVAVLLGALNASRWASRPFGPDAVRVRQVEDLARAALGLEFGPRYEEGRGLGDVGAVALARRIIDGSPLPTAPRAT
jgi:predicted ATPase/DNA-binding SARP family transcriptional activator